MNQLQLREYERCVGGTMGVFTIPSGKIFDENCESLDWRQSFCAEVARLFVHFGQSQSSIILKRVGN